VIILAKHVAEKIIMFPAPTQKLGGHKDGDHSRRCKQLWHEASETGHGVISTGNIKILPLYNIWLNSSVDYAEN
jgi:hypothetical protein